MDFTRFQVDVIDLAASGVPLTVANVVAHLRIDPDRAERMLDRMAREGRLDVDVDDVQGAIVYRVRGLSTRPAQPIMHADPWSYRRPADHHLDRLRPAKSVTLAVVLAVLFPGFGLAYVAPVRVVVAWTAAVVLLGKFFGASLLLGPFFWMMAIVVSALFGGLYAVRFNQEGHRAPLFP